MRPHADRSGIFRSLYQAHYQAIAAYARRRVAPSEAEDVVADTFLVAWRRFDDAPSGDQTLPWLYGVARKVISQRLRTTRRRDRLVARLVRMRWPFDVSVSE